MKIFIYKTLFVLVCLIFLFQFTIGSKLNQIEQNILQLKSKENIENAKDKIRLEIKSGLKKDKILSPEDAKLIKSLIDKLSKELLLTN